MASKWPILKEYFLTKYMRSFLNREVLENWQSRQIVSHVKRILPLSSFYREYYAGYSIENWKELPLIDKKIMMNHFDTLNTAGIKKEDAFRIGFEAEKTRKFSVGIQGIAIGLSSGTSGNRGIFLANRQEREAWAGAMLAKMLPKSLLQQQRIALFLRSNSSLYQTTKSRLIQFDYYDLLDPLESHIRTLNRNPPTLLAAPPSMLRLLCSELSQGRLAIHPEKIVSIAEVLDPLDQAIIENAFQQKLHQIYQCTEGFLGATCPFGTLHLNEDLAAIQKEYLSTDKFMPIITDFRRISQPILRYRLNDILTEKKSPCPCGSVFTCIEKIEGRSDDIFYLEHEKTGRLVPVFPDFIRHAIADSSPLIQEFFAIQLKRDLIEISFNPEQDPIRRAVCQSLESLFIRLSLKLPRLKFTTYSHLPTEKKMRRIRSCYVPN